MMSDKHSISIERTPSVDRLIKEFIQARFKPERDQYPDIDDKAFQLLIYIRGGEVITYHNPFYNGDDDNSITGYYRKINDHTLIPIIPAPTDAQREQVRQFLNRKTTFYDDAIAALIQLMLAQKAIE